MLRSAGLKIGAVVAACALAGLFLASMPALAGNLCFSGIGIDLDRQRGLILLMRSGTLTVNVGGKLDVDLLLLNTGRSPVTLEYSSACVSDLLVYSLAGELVTYWSKHQLFLQVLTDVTLQPGEIRVSRLPWEHFGQDGVQPGVYLLKATIFYLTTASIPIIVLP